MYVHYSEANDLTADGSVRFLPKTPIEGRDVTLKAPDVAIEPLDTIFLLNP